MVRLPITFPPVVAAQQGRAAGAAGRNELPGTAAGPDLGTAYRQRNAEIPGDEPEDDVLEQRQEVPYGDDER
jgi:hypothetical protein